MFDETAKWNGVGKQSTRARFTKKKKKRKHVEQILREGVLLL